MNIEISIPDDFGKDLVQSTVKIEKDLLASAKDVINQALLAIETQAKEYAPVDTGRLRSSIHAVGVGIADRHRYADDEGRSYDGALIDGKTNEGSNMGMVGTNVEYAPEQEFGSEGGKGGHRFLTRATAAIQPKLVAELKRIKL